MNRKEYERLVEKLNGLTLCDDWMFKEVMQDEENLPIIKEFLEMLLKTKIYQITPVQTEVEEKPEYGFHGVRFDPQLVQNGVITAIEMQTYKTALPLRARFYHDVLDIRNYDPENDKHENYESLPETLIIFLLDKDYLGGDLQKYTVKSMVQENLKLKYDDKRTTIFLNPKASTNDERLNNFCEFLDTGEPNDPLTKEFYKAVAKVKSSPLKRSNFMSLEDRIEHDIKKAKIDQKLENARNIALKMLSKSYPIEEIVEISGLNKQQLNELKKSL